MPRTRLLAAAVTAVVLAAVSTLPAGPSAPPAPAAGGVQMASQDPFALFERMPTATTATSEPDAQVAPPPLQRRVQWDTAGDCPATSGDRTTPRRIHLHHTHLPVVHSPAEVPDAMAGICTAHQGRGMDEIGYHYAVDPYGRIWQGRGDRLDRLRPTVREGAHAQGFNDGSIGVVLIGDFDVAPPTAAALEATVELLAHLSAHYGIDVDVPDEVTSTGGPLTRFDDGEQAHLHGLSGHRDTGKDTSCPGEHLYALLPQLREQVTERADRLAAG